MEGQGLPLAVEIEGAQRHDKKLLEATLAALVLAIEPESETNWHLCLDAGYDYLDIPPMVEAHGYVPHIRSRREERAEQVRYPHKQPRRWVVERTASWLNRYRRLLIRWEKKAENYLGFLHLACALICLRATGLFG